MIRGIASALLIIQASGRITRDLKASLTPEEMDKLGENVFESVPAQAKAPAEGMPAFLHPPDPVGQMPKKDKDGAYATKEDACAACKYVASGSCAMYRSCFCNAANANFGALGIAEPTDTESWKWACGAEGGSRYSSCFQVTYSDAEATYQDSFGETIDPNNPK